MPESFLSLAHARSMGAAVRVMQGGSRLQAMRDKLLTIAVFQHGAVVGNAADPQPIQFRYDEVDRFTQWVVAKYVNGAYRSTDITCWFGLTDGRSYRIGGQSTPAVRHIVEDFRQLVDPPITAAQLPRMYAALQQGQTLDFGGYRMEPTGLHIPAGFLRREKRLAWADIKEVTVQDGNVKVIVRGRRRSWAIVGVQSVPNLGAFLTLVRSATSA